jgi:hypothetical protein
VEPRKEERRPCHEGVLGSGGTAPHIL